MPYKETTYVGKAMAADNISDSWPRIENDGNPSQCAGAFLLRDMLPQLAGSRDDG